jgi:hypothetical protein
MLLFNSNQTLPDRLKAAWLAASPAWKPAVAASNLPKPALGSSRPAQAQAAAAAAAASYEYGWRPLIAAFLKYAESGPPLEHDWGIFVGLDEADIEHDAEETGPDTGD